MLSTRKNITPVLPANRIGEAVMRQLINCLIFFFPPIEAPYDPGPGAENEVYIRSVFALPGML